MNSLPTISILTPVWNGLPYLRECVASVLAQEYQDWELLISDNGSTDGTLEYLHTLTDPRIRIFEQKNNLGIMGNVNFLFRNARSPLSQILCADDFFVKPTALGKIAAYWKNASAEIGFARFGHIGSSDKKIVNIQTQMIPSVIRKEFGDLLFFVFGNFPGNLSDVSIRTHLVRENGYFPVHMPFAGDCAFWSRLIRKVSMGVEQELLIYIRRHDKVASNYLGLKGELYEQQVDIYEKLIESMSGRYDINILKKYFHYQVYAFHYRNALKSLIHGKFTYLQTLIKVDSVILWPRWQQLLLCLPFALFNVRQGLTYDIAINLLQQYDQRADAESLLPELRTETIKI
ncbi:MAG TPA: glycosyltransferase family 2 protein [Pedobacter sp.]|nr:glycosyltransferase family 2 protein [Pedobacter sp.]